MKKTLRNAAFLAGALFALSLPAPAACQVERVDLDVQGYLCGL